MGHHRYRHKHLVDTLLSQGYEVKRLRDSVKKDLIGKYQKAVKYMMAYSFPDYFHGVVLLILNPFYTDFVTCIVTLYQCHA